MDDMDIQTTTFLRSVEIMVPVLPIVVNMSISGFRQVQCGLFRPWSLSRSFITSKDSLSSEEHTNKNILEFKNGMQIGLRSSITKKYSVIHWMTMTVTATHTDV